MIAMDSLQKIKANRPIIPTITSLEAPPLTFSIHGPGVSNHELSFSDYIDSIATHNSTQLQNSSNKKENEQYGNGVDVNFVLKKK